MIPAFFSPSPMELMVVLGIVLLLFGPSQLPKVARGIGSSITEFRKGVKNLENDGKEIADEVRSVANSVKV